VFFATHHLRLETFLLQGGDYLLADFGQQFLAVTPGVFQCRQDPLGAHRVERVETEVFELHAHVVHAQTHGDGGVDIEGFTGDTPALVDLKHTQGTHVMQSIGQLHQDDTNVLGHRQGHFLEILRLLFR